MSTKKVEINYSALADPIAKQLGAQKLDFDKKKVQGYQKSVDSILYLRFGGLLTDSEVDRCFGKLHKAIIKHLEAQLKKGGQAG